MLEDHYTTSWSDVCIMHTSTSIEPHFMSVPWTFRAPVHHPLLHLVVHDTLMVHGLLVSVDGTVLKLVQTVNLLSIT